MNIFLESLKTTLLVQKYDKIESLDEDQLKQFVKEIDNINYKGITHKTNLPLLVCQNENITCEILEILVDKGADLYSKGIHSSPIAKLYLNRNLSQDLLELMIKKKIGLNFASIEGRVGNKGENENENKRKIVNAFFDPFGGNKAIHLLCQNENVTKEILELVLDYSKTKYELHIKEKLNGSTPLHFLCKNRKTRPDLLKVLLENGADPLIANSNQETCIHLLCQNESLSPKSLKMLIDQTNNYQTCVLESADFYGDTPLHLLCKNPKITTQLLKILLSSASRKVDLKNKRTKNRTTKKKDGNSLYYLCRNTSITPDLLEMFLEYSKLQGFDLNYIDTLGKRALDVLCENPKITSELLKIYFNHSAGMTVKFSTDSIQSALPFLCLNEKITPKAVIVLINNGCQVKYLDPYNKTALHCLCQNPQITPELLNILINNGANVNIPNYKNETPLHFLCKNTSISPDLLKIFIHKGCHDNNFKSLNDNFIQEEALHSLCQNPQITPELLNILINNGVDINYQNSSGMNAMHFICKNHHLNNIRELISTLITKGAQVYNQNQNCYTPFWYLINNPKINTKSIKVFLYNGNNKNNNNKNNEKNKTNYKFNNVNNKSDNILKPKKVISSSSNLSNQFLLTYCTSRYITIKGLQLFVESNEVDLNYQNTKTFEKETALHFLCQNPKITPELLNILINMGASVNIPNYKNETPLHFLCKNEKITQALLKIMINKGANVNFLNKNKSTPIVYLCQNNSLSRDLLEMYFNGKSINENNFQENLLHLICKNKNTNSDLLKMFFKIQNEHKDLLINCQNKASISTALYFICGHSSDLTPELIQIFFRQGANVNSLNQYDQTPLHSLCQNTFCSMNIKLFQLFAKNGAKFNIKDKFGNLPFIYFLNNSKQLKDQNEQFVNLLRYIINITLNHENQTKYINKISTSKSTGNATTLLHIICSNYKFISNELLMDAIQIGEFDINSKDQGHNTALHLLCDNSLITPQLLETLLTNGANVNSQNKSLQTPLCILIDNLSTHINIFHLVYLLLKYGAKTQFKFYYYVIQQFSFSDREEIEKEFHSVSDILLENYYLNDNQFLIKFAFSKINFQQLSLDFKNYWVRKEFTNGTIMEIKCNKLLIETRIGLPFEKIKTILENKKKNFSQKNINEFLNWVYTDELPKEIKKTSSSSSSSFGSSYSSSSSESSFFLKHPLIEIFEALGINVQDLKNNTLKTTLSKLYNDEKSKDYLIIVENKPIKVHKIVLQARSELYRKMFLSINENMSEKQINDYSGQTFDSMEIIIKHLYSINIEKSLLTNEIIDIIESTIDYFLLNSKNQFLLKLIF
ncbi:ankyrin repeat family protein [Anaeramoeba flamelloides]|uniref:Ankyrin repeat family protein n=1 Tax=Anaeramoeba flamelloides TaxID=1746091 RepID=A0AAV7Z2T7_9EUKA|nr:ankyrin repeat family protein [Anaeramoeba flamelloides]